MADNLMYIPNDNTQNYPFFILQLVVETLGLNILTNQNSIQVSKVVKPTNKKTLKLFTKFLRIQL